LALSAFTSLDVFLVKALLRQNEPVGFYTSAVVLAQIPYTLLVGYGINVTLLPAVAQSLSNSTNLQTKFYINRSLRYSLLLLMPLTFLVSTTSENLVSLVYTARYAAASDPLRILIFGYLFLSLFAIGTTIITAMGKPQVAMVLAFLMVGLDFGLNRALIPLCALSGAALATTLAGFIGALGALAYVFHRFRRLMSPVSFAKITGASAIISLLSLVISFPGIGLLASYTVLLALYVALLIFFKEVGPEEWLLVKQTLCCRAILGWKRGRGGEGE